MVRKSVHNTKKDKISKNESGILILFFILIIFGIAMLTSASTVIGYTNHGDNYYFLKNQLLKGFLPGLILFFIFTKINYEFWKRKASLIFIAGIVLLLAVFLPGIGVEINNAKSWINLGVANFQTSEAMKLVIIIYLAALFAKNKNKIKDFEGGMLPFLVTIGISSFLIALQPDIGTMMILVIIGFGIFFASGASFKHLLGIMGAGAVAVFFLIKSASYRLDRFLAFIDPSQDAQGVGYHITQALLAVGSGGLWGLGFGKSRQKFEFLPEVDGDSVFAIMAEELGFILTTIFIILFIYFVLKIFGIAKKQKNDFAKLFATGLAMWIGAQGVINIGAMIGILPLTGVPLPFVSYGGSSLMILMASMGILRNIEKN
jgi:cell division protein FtsW